MNISDTVAAVSTPRGLGGIAVIRISGERCREIISRVFVPAGKHCPTDEPRRAVYGTLYAADGSVLDRVLVTFFAAPASYTGEDMAEISCHGGVYVTNEVLTCVLAAGARAAEGGEFTHRAFINGKLTLTEAEAVGELLEADTADRLALASSALSGRLSDSVRGIGDRLCDAMTALYAEIDYPEEDLAGMNREQIGDAFLAALRDTERLLSTFRRGRAVSQGVSCAICGSPNAGKSSLYNRITGHNSAIVTDIAGTTRDVLRERVAFGGVTLELCDTAGLRDSDDTVESIGVERARETVREAELVLAVFDGSEHLTEEQRENMSLYSRESAVAVINKSDLDCVLDGEERELLESCHAKCVCVSCESGDGLDALSEAIGALFDAGSCRLGEDAVIWSARQKAALSASAEYLSEALCALEAGESPDALCTLCESALGELMGTDGRGVTEEIVSGIFSRFCVGK